MTYGKSLHRYIYIRHLTSAAHNILNSGVVRFAMYSKLLLLVWLIPYLDAVKITIKQGTLRGTTQLSRNGTKYYSFFGIPFARPPIGKLRFEPPQWPDPWIGIRDASEASSECPQLNNTDVIGDEDCLYLNVHTPAQKSTPLPVMIFIHGGGFTVGSGDMNPKYFMDYPVVFVSIQYRLHIFGFLSTGDHVSPGNNGLKDQVAALKWVQKNIATFGGDPKQVTIFGESAGSASIHYHIHSPLSTGLFHRAISESGTSLGYFAYIPRTMAHHRSQALGVLTSCSTKNSQTLVDCLKTVPADDLVLANEKFYTWSSFPVTSFGPVAEPELEGAFITQNPWYHEAVNNVPWICGINSGEGGMMVAGLLVNNASNAKVFDEYYKRLIPISLYLRYWYDDDTKIEQIAEKIRSYYFVDKEIGVETSKELVQFYTDATFLYSAVEAVKRHKNTVYFYFYDHRNNKSFSEIFSGYKPDLGVVHMDELISLFPFDQYIPEGISGDDVLVSKRMVKYWVNFAQTGNPNDDNDIWTPVKKGDLQFLHIATNEDTMKTGLHREQYQFWKGLDLRPPFEGGSCKPDHSCHRPGGFPRHRDGLPHRRDGFLRHRDEL